MLSRAERVFVAAAAAERRSELEDNLPRHADMPFQRDSAASFYASNTRNSTAVGSNVNQVKSSRNKGQ